ncbi:MAG: hypothetical protein LUD27_07480, partial [Clostridia bacterium]|nr:hypothetical protein [Clostridia bacterium]
TITCSACGSAGVMDKYGRFQEDYPVHTVKEWIQSQEAYVRTLPYASEEPFFRENVMLRKLVREKHRKEVISKKAEARLYYDRLEVGSMVFL